MGALHAGHLSLVKIAQSHVPHVAVSIFVNPTQFGPSEDFSRYPRPIEKDLEMCRSAGVDMVFMPSPEEMYPVDAPKIAIDLPSLTTPLEGEHRPGHFAGVCMVVAKLLNIVDPVLSCFGEKDFQQLAVIRGMVRALDMRSRILGCPTLRDPDGLAMSSRNQYLSPRQRERALSISRSLREVQNSVIAGVRDARELQHLMVSILKDGRGFDDVPTDLQYARIVDRDTLSDIDRVEREARAVIAMKVGATRLIDNVALNPSTSST